MFTFPHGLKLLGATGWCRVTNTLLYGELLKIDGTILKVHRCKSYVQPLYFFKKNIVANLLHFSLLVHKAMQRSKSFSKRTTMLNGGGRSTKNSHPFCQSLLASLASMIIKQLHIRMIVVELVSWLYI
jgi:hypothetical protein